MRQREIWNIYFDPIVGSEQSGNRPAVIVSGDLLNKNLDVIWVCPLSSSIHNFEGNPVLEPDEENGLSKKSEVMVFHLRLFPKKRFKRRIGLISKVHIEEIIQTINDILEL